MAAKPKPVEPKTEAEKQAVELQIVEQSKRIDFYITEYSVELLAKKLHDEEFVIPAYQREFTWDAERKSRFIESVVMGLPIPFLFFWEMENGKLEIVDGSQRLRTLEEFLHGGLRLADLEGLTLMSGFTFAELPESRQRKIGNRSIRGIVLNEHADEEARFDLFDRINTGSMIANKAEVRRGVLSGPFLALVTELALHPQFVTLAPMSTSDVKKREREELVTRFFAYSDGLDGYHDRPSEFLFNYVKKMNAAVVEDPALVSPYRQRFVDAMALISEVFPYGFRRNPKGKATPRARFEAIAIGTQLARNESPGLSAAQVPDVNVWLNKAEFRRVTGSDGANAIARLRERTEFVRDKLLGEGA